MTLGLRAKILWIAGLVMAVALVAITLTAGRFFSAAYVVAITQSTKAISHEVSVQFERLLAFGLHPEEIIGFDELCAKVQRNHRDLEFVAVASPSGRLLFHSAPGAAGASISDAVLRDAVAAGREIELGVERGEAGYLASVMPVFTPAREHVAAVIVAQSMRAVDRRVTAALADVLLVGLVLLLVSAGILYWAISRFVTTPLQAVVSAVDRLAAQAPEAQHRVDAKAEAELGVLVDGFNLLLGRLARHREELVSAREEAVSASRAKTKFLANVSHELRTPLNGILGMNAVLLRTELDDRQRRCAHAVAESGDRLLQMIERVLDFASADSGAMRFERRPFGLRDLVVDVQRRAETAAAAKGLLLTCDVDPGCPDAVQGDRGRLLQVLGNLLDNAIKFTEHGFVYVAVRAHGERDVEFEVADSGIGIAAEMQATLFQPFRQVDGSDTRRFDGAGLGLALSRQLVLAMGGAITLQSDVGRGTMLRVVLPLLEPAEVAAAVPPACASAAP